STSPAFVCGTPVALTLNLAYLGGSDSSPISLRPSGNDYTVTQSSGASIVPGTTDVGLHADDSTTSISLPFTYTFYGQNYITAALSSNGNLQFGTSNIAFSNSCLPSSGFSDAIFGFWDD